MNKLFIVMVALIFTLSQNLSADGGALGLQLGGITFGLGGSSRGPILGIGPSPDNGLPIAVPFVPGDCNSCNTSCNTCNTCNRCN